jgi:hypothetical protein
MSQPVEVCPACYGRTEADDDRCISCGISLGERSIHVGTAWAAGPWTESPGPFDPDARADERDEPGTPKEILDAVS